MIIKAKLKSPRLGEEVILRKRILKKLDEKKHTVIIGPSGYGKTVLLSQIEQEQPHIWYTVDEFDDDIYIFLRYLIEGLEEQIEGIAKQFDNYIGNIKQEIQPYEIANELINCLIDSDKTIIIKFDNFHWIQDQKIRAFLKILLQYSPSNLRVLIATRRAYIQEHLNWMERKFNFVTEADLIFDEKERIAYLGSELIQEEKVKAYLDKPANCIAVSLHLIKKVYIHHLDKDMNFLFESFVESLVPFKKEILILAGYLPYATAEIINYILGIHNAEEVLEELIEKGYLIYKIQNHYMYNDLFRNYLTENYEMLKEWVKQSIEFAIHKKQEKWAVEIALCHKAQDRVEYIFEKTRCKYLCYGYYEYLMEWNAHLVYEDILTSPVLQLIKLKVSMLQGGKIYIKDIDYLQSLFKDVNDLIQIHFDLIRFNILIWENEKEAVQKLASKLCDQITWKYNKVIGEFLGYLSNINIEAVLSGWQVEFMIQHYLDKLDYQNIGPNEVFNLHQIECFYIRNNQFQEMKQVNRILNDKGGVELKDFTYLGFYLSSGKVEEVEIIIAKQMVQYEKYKRINDLQMGTYMLAYCKFIKQEYDSSMNINRQGFIEQISNRLLKMEAVVLYIRCLIYAQMLKEAEAMLKEGMIFIEALSPKTLYSLQAELALKKGVYDLGMQYIEKSRAHKEDWLVALPSERKESLIYPILLIYEGREQEVLEFYKKEAITPSHQDVGEIQLFIREYKKFAKFLSSLPALPIQIYGILNQKQVEMEGMKEKKQKYLEVRFFGENLVSCNGQIMKWRTTKARDIFYYLAYRGEKGVNREELMDMFWQDKGRDRASAVLASNISYIRKTIKEVGIEESMINYVNKRYYINSHYVSSDLKKLEEGIDKLTKGKMEERIEVITQLYDIVQQDFAKDLEIDELIGLEFNLQSQIHRVVVQLIEELEEVKQTYKITEEMKKILREFI